MMVLRSGNLDNVLTSPNFGPSSDITETKTVNLLKVRIKKHPSSGLLTTVIPTKSSSTPNLKSIPNFGEFSDEEDNINTNLKFRLEKLSYLNKISPEKNSVCNVNAQVNPLTRVKKSYCLRSLCNEFEFESKESDNEVLDFTQDEYECEYEGICF